MPEYRTLNTTTVGLIMTIVKEDNEYKTLLSEVVGRGGVGTDNNLMTKVSYVSPV